MISVDRYFAETMFKCRVNFERNFKKLPKFRWSPDDVTPLPELLACRPWLALQDLVQEQGAAHAVDTAWNKNESLSNSCCRDSAVWYPMKNNLKTSYFHKKTLRY